MDCIRRRVRVAQRPSQRHVRRSAPPPSFGHPLPSTLFTFTGALCGNCGRCMAVSVLGLLKVARCTARIHSHVLATMALGVQVGLQWKLRSFDLKSLAIIHYRIEVPLRADCAPRNNGFLLFTVRPVPSGTPGRRNDPCLARPSAVCRARSVCTPAESTRSSPAAGSSCLHAGFRRACGRP